MKKLIKLLAVICIAVVSSFAQTTTINGIYGQSIGIPIYAPTIIQKANATTGSTGKTLVTTFAKNTSQGTTIIAACGGSNYASSSWTATVTDSQGNTFTQDVLATQSTTQFAGIFRAQNTVGGTADALTLTIAGTNSANESLACEIYELMGLYSPGSALDQSKTASNAGSTSPSAGSATPSQSVEYAFTAIAAGATSTPTITAGTSQSWLLDSGTLAPASGSLTFGAESLPIMGPPSSITGNGTLSASNAWAAAMATYRVFVPPVQTCDTDGTNCIVKYVDPCLRGAKSFYSVSLTANTQIISGTSGKQTYFCSINLVAGAATNVAIVEGTGTTCGSSTAGMAGGSTAATGWNFAANGGLTEGNGGSAIMATATTGDNVCILVSAANQISGAISYVQY